MHHNPAHQSVKFCVILYEFCDDTMTITDNILGCVWDAQGLLTEFDIGSFLRDTIPFCY